MRKNELVQKAILVLQLDGLTASLIRAFKHNLI